MKTLNKKLLIEIIDEYLNPDVGTVISNEPVADFRNYDPTNELISFEEETQRIVELLRDFTTSARNGLKAGKVTAEQGQKIVDFQLSRIQRALDYTISTIDAYSGESLDMTTPEV